MKTYSIRGYRVEECGASQIKINRAFEMEIMGIASPLQCGLVIVCELNFKQIVFTWMVNSLSVSLFVPSASWSISGDPQNPPIRDPKSSFEEFPRGLLNE